MSAKGQGNVSDKSPEELPEDAPLEDDALRDPEELADETTDEVEETDDEVIERLDSDLPADESPRVAPIRRKTAKAPVRKSAPTRKRSDAEHEAVDPYKAKNPGHFVRQSAGELKKVVWPTWPTLVRYFFAVLIFVLFIITFVGLLDWAYGWGLLQILGK